MSTGEPFERRHEPGGARQCLADWAAWPLALLGGLRVFLIGLGQGPVLIAMLLAPLGTVSIVNLRPRDPFPRHRTGDRRAPDTGRFVDASARVMPLCLQSTAVLAMLSGLFLVLTSLLFTFEPVFAFWGR